MLQIRRLILSSILFVAFRREVRSGSAEINIHPDLDPALTVDPDHLSTTFEIAIELVKPTEAGQHAIKHIEQFRLLNVPKFRQSEGDPFGVNTCILPAPAQFQVVSELKIPDVHNVVLPKSLLDR
jgi:hypothetical protein